MLLAASAFAFSPSTSSTPDAAGPLYSVVQDQLVESADGFGNGAGGNAGSQGVRDCTAGGCDNDKYEDEQVVLPWATSQSSKSNYSSVPKVQPQWR